MEPALSLSFPFFFENRQVGLQERKEKEKENEQLIEWQVVADVLDSCGNNIDEAIKLLGALQLSRANRATPQGKTPLNGSLESQARADLSQASTANPQGAIGSLRV